MNEHTEQHNIPSFKIKPHKLLLRALVYKYKNTDFMSRQTLANLFYFYVNDLFIKSFDFLVNFQDIFIFHPSKKKISNIWNWTIFEICCIQTLFACVYHHIYSHWVYKKVLNNVRSLLSIRQVILNMLTNNLRKC